MDASHHVLRFLLTSTGAANRTSSASHRDRSLVPERHRPVSNFPKVYSLFGHSEACGQPVHTNEKGSSMDFARAATMTLAVATLVACSNGSTPTGDTSMDGAVPSGRGTGSISGQVNGRTFDNLSDAWLIGRPDDAAHTLVLHLLDQPVGCQELSAAGWDTSIADATQVLEIKLIGTEAGVYDVPADGHPGTGQADVNYTLSSRAGAPGEVSARGGQVDWTQLVANSDASGSFDVTFPGGSVAGEFHAIYCPGGREP